MHHLQDDERPQDDHDQADSDDVTAPESHRQHHHDNHNQHGFYQIDHKHADCALHSGGLKKHLLKINACRNNRLFQLCQFPVDNLSQLDDVSPFFHSNGNGNGGQGVIQHSFPLRFDIAFGYDCHIPQSNMVLFVPSNQQIPNILNVVEIPVNSHANPLFSAVVITGIHRCILSFQREDNLGGMNPQIRHFRLLDVNVYAGLPFSVNVHAAHAVNIQNGTPDQLGVIHHLLITEPVRSHRIKHTVHIPEIIEHHRRLRSLRQLALDVGNLPAQDVPVLLQFGSGHGASQFHQDIRNVVHRPGLHVVQVAHRTD